MRREQLPAHVGRAVQSGLEVRGHVVHSRLQRLVVSTVEADRIGFRLPCRMRRRDRSKYRRVIDGLSEPHARLRTPAPGGDTAAIACGTGENGQRRDIELGRRPVVTGSPAARRASREGSSSAVNHPRGCDGAGAEQSDEDQEIPGVVRRQEHHECGSEQPAAAADTRPDATGPSGRSRRARPETHDRSRDSHVEDRTPRPAADERHELHQGVEPRP